MFAQRYENIYESTRDVKMLFFCTVGIYSRFSCHDESFNILPVNLASDQLRWERSSAAHSKMRGSIQRHTTEIVLFNSLQNYLEALNKRSGPGMPAYRNRGQQCFMIINQAGLVT